MPEAVENPPVSQQQHRQLQEAYDELQQEHQAIKQELAWLKRQLFGRKSEKRLVDQPSHSGLLFEAAPEPDKPAPTEQISYTLRKRSKDRGDAVTDTGLRFNDGLLRRICGRIRPDFRPGLLGLPGVSSFLKKCIPATSL